MSFIKYALYRFHKLKQSISSIKGNLLLLYSINFISGMLLTIPLILVLFTVIQVGVIKRISFLSFFIVIFLLSGYFYKSHIDYQIQNDIRQNSGQSINSRVGKVIELEYTGSFSKTYIVKIKDSMLLHLLDVPIDKDYLGGQVIKIGGTIKKLDRGAFDTSYVNYLNSKKVYYSIDTKYVEKLDNNNYTLVLSRIKQQFEGFIGKKISAEHASLLNGILFGSKDNLDDNTKLALTRSGTSHIISASGFNVMIIFLFLSQSGSFVNKGFVRLISMPLMFLYVIFIGWSIFPARRALYMIIILLFSNNFGRKIPVFNLLVYSVVLMLLEFPGYISNISLQLSVLATVGLLVSYEKINYFFMKKLKINKVISNILAATFSATLATMPLTILTFGSLSLISLITNVLILPFVPILMLLAALLVVSNIINLDILATFIAILANSLLDFVLNIIKFLASLDFANSADSKVITLFCLASFSILVLADYFFVNNEKFKNNTRINRRISNIR